MSDEHGLTLLESELTEITRKVDECRAADPRLAELAQEHATLRYSLAELRAIADQLRTDLELLTLAETQRRPSIIDLEEWKARNPE
jgi:hypothetical protein